MTFSGLVYGPQSIPRNHMNIEIPEELQQLKENLRRFVDNVLIPVELDSLDGHLMKPDLLADIRRKSENLGLSGYDVPEEYGGLGLGMMARAVVWSELGRTTALPTRNFNLFGPNVSPILYHLNEDQKERYLKPVLRGEKASCFAQTEPDAGGDPGSMRTVAMRNGDHYVINGSKRFITGAGQANFAQVFAYTDRSKGTRGGITGFLVDMDTPGVSIIRQERTMMHDRPYELAFDDVRVPIENRIGEEGDGFKHAQGWITSGRIRHGARAIGVIERCLEMASSYASQRVTFGEPLAQRQSIQWMLVEMAMNLHSLKLMVFDAASKYDRGIPIREESYMIKIAADPNAFSAADMCMQIHGGLGLTLETPIERFWRDSRSMIITEGAPEILKSALARQLFRQYA